MTKKLGRVLGGDIETNTYEELGEAFQKLMDEQKEKKYGVKLSTDAIQWITLNFLPTLKWRGQNVYDIVALNEGINSLVANETVMLTREEIKSIFHFIANGEYEGANEVYIIKEVLTDLSNVVREIGEDEQLVRDAGFELQAAEQGVTPESLAKEGDQQ